MTAVDGERAGTSDERGASGAGTGRPVAGPGVDALIVTALHDELEALLALGEGGRGGWREARDPGDFPYHVREIPNERGQSLRIAAAWSGQMGERAAAARAQALIDHLDPSCLAMCGICAGRRGEVSLGDVIVADRVYSYDEGKHVAPANAGAGGFFHDIETYNLEKTWNMDAAFFAREFAKTTPLAQQRPPPAPSQARWLLHALYASQVEGGPSPVGHADRARACPGWTERLGELEAQGLLRIGDDGLELTEAGIKQVRRDRVTHPDGPPLPRPFQVHVGPIVTGSAVEEDPGLFDRLKPIGRKILGVEMEAAAIGYVAERGGCRAIVVKAVSDHGDHDKDDSFRGFACRASAEFLVAFLCRHLRPVFHGAAERAPRPQDDRPRSAAARRSERLFHGRGADILLTDGRSDDFLSRVERVCRLREPEGAELKWFDAPLPFGVYLRVSVNDGGIAKITPLGALETGISVEALEAFLATIDASYRRDDPGLVSTLVYGGEPAPDELVRHASANRVRLVRFLEYQGLIDFRGYLAWQTARLERDPTYPPALYVDQRIALTVGQDEALRENALDAFAELLDAEHSRFVLVLGDFGTGKTFLLHELARRMGKRGGPVTPVLIEMRALEKARDLNALIAQHLALAGMGRIDLTAFRHMLAEGRIALLFDGFDELAFRVTYDRAVEHFDTLIQAAQGKAAKVVVTSRSQHFISEQQVRSALAERAAVLPGYRLAKIQPFTEAQIRRSLVNRLGDDGAADARMRLLADVKDLLGLSANPRMLGFIAEIEEAQLRQAKAGDGEITSAGLYKLLLDRWLVWEYERAHPKGAQPGLSVAQRWWAVTELAMRLWQRTERSVSVRELPAELIAALQALGKHELDRGVTEHQIGSGTLLVWDEQENFRFIHQSVLEWLVARAAAEEVVRTGEVAALVHREVSDLMADFFGALAGREAAGRWARAALGGAWGAVAAANALRLDGRMGLGVGERMNLAGADLRGQDLSGKDLSYCDLQGADLREAKLVGTNLTGAKLSGAKLDGADLTGAALVGADLTGASAVRARLVGADLQGAKLASARLRGAKLVGARDAVLEGCDTFGAALPEMAIHAPTWVSHSGGDCLAISHDGSLLASSHGGDIVLWEVATGSALRVLKGHSELVRSLVFSPEGDSLASGSVDRTVRLWDVSTGNVLCVLKGHSGGVRSVAFSPDGEMLASGCLDGAVRLWQVTTCSELSVLQSQSDGVTAVAFSPDGKVLASGAYDSTVRLWAVPSGDALRVLEGHARSVMSVAFSPDGKVLASGAYDSTVRLWAVPSGDALRVLEGHESGVTSVAFSPDGATLASGSRDNTVRLWEMTSGDALRVLEGHESRVTSVAFSPDGEMLASGSRDSTVWLWEMPSGDVLRVLKGRSQPIMKMAMSRDGALIAFNSRDAATQLWEVRSGNTLRTLRGRWAIQLKLTFSPDGATLASGARDNIVRVWQVSTGKVARELRGHSNHVTSVAFSPDGTTLASGSLDTRVLLWDVATGVPLRMLRGHSGGIQSVAFSPDGVLLASGAEDRTVRLWHIADEGVVHVLEGHERAVLSVVFSPDGALLASGGLDSLLLWRAATGESIGKLQGHSGPVTGVVFSPDGSLLASIAYDISIRLWEAPTGDIVRVLRGHSDRVTSVAFSPDGATLVSSSTDSTLRFWDVRTGACLAVLLKLPEGWVAFRPDGRYKFGGDIAGGFWHAANLCRFEPGELDALVPGLRIPDDAPLLPERSLPGVRG